MKVTPLKKKFGKHEVGSVFDLPDKAARLFIKVGKLQEANPSQTYTTRDMRAYQTTPVAVVAKDPPTDPPAAEPVVSTPAEATEAVSTEATVSGDNESAAVGAEEAGGDNTPDADAPWGRKADGTPKKRPGRAPAVTE